MDFSVGTLNKLKESFQKLKENISEKLNCKKIGNISREVLKNRSVTKEMLVDTALKCMGSIVTKIRIVLQTATVKFDEQKTNNQKELIHVQSELIACQRTLSLI